MNEENENIENPAEDSTNEPEILDESQEKSRFAGTGMRYIIGVSILLVVAAMLIWLYFGRNSGGRPVPAPSDMTFDGKPDGDNAGNSGEQRIELTDEQLAAADLKIVTVGEGLSRASAAAAATGVVQPNEYRETPVIALVGGVVRRVNAELGQFVRAGQTIAIVYSDELARNESDLLAKRADVNEAEKRYQRSQKLTGIASESRNEFDEAKAKLWIAQAEHEEHYSHFLRTQKLVEIGAVSREEFEMVKSRHEVSLAAYEEARNRFSRAEKLLAINPARRAEQDAALRQLETARAELAAMKQRLLVLGLSSQRVDSLTASSQISAELPILSPVSGTVTMRKINDGEAITANAELMKVTNLTTVWVIGQVYEKDLAGLRIGSGTSVTTDAFPGEIFRGNISYIDPNLDQATRTARIRIELPNVGDRLKIGMFVNIAFAVLGGAENTVPMVPRSAVQNINGRQVVFAATDNPNVFIVKPVRIGTEIGEMYPILEGIFVGEKIVAEGSFLLRAELNK